MRQLGFVQLTICADPAADVEREGAYLRDGFGNVGRTQAARHEDRHVDRLADATADGPVVTSARAAEFLDRKRRVAGVEQDRIDLRRNCQRLGERLLAGDMDDLDDRNAGQGRAQVSVVTARQAVNTVIPRQSASPAASSSARTGLAVSRPSTMFTL